VLVIVLPIVADFVFAYWWLVSYDIRVIVQFKQSHIYKRATDGDS